MELRDKRVREIVKQTKNHNAKIVSADIGKKGTLTFWRMGISKSFLKAVEF